ncbi:MAG TPA: hypothetical protein VMW84_01365, partial [Acidobacteriota bacterium]|nr:hypothetical protein [Acidobacteriota bacterium]
MTVWEEFLKIKGWTSKYESVDRALRHYSRKVKSQKTKENFCTTLTQFCKYSNLSPDALATLTPKNASRRCQDFTDNLREKDYSIRYINVSQAYLRTFFRENGFRANRELTIERYHQP